MRGSATYWSIFLVIVILTAVVLLGLWPQDKTFEEATGLIDIELWRQLKEKAHGIGGMVDSEVEKFAEEAREKTVSLFEHQEIDIWLRVEGLNQFADPPGTVYAGGTPLFDEQIGKTQDRYEYIIQNHPDRPWRN